MRYDLIWKSIDAELTIEETSLLNDALEKEPTYLTQLKRAKELDQALGFHFNHKIDAAFILRLKKSVLEEFDLPNMKINYLPIVLFVLLALLITFGFSYMPSKSHVDLNLDVSIYMPWILMVMTVSFAGLLLFGLDLVLKTKYKRV